MKLLNEKIFNIDISFVNDFIELVDKEDFIIHHQLLEKYGVITIKDTFYVKRLLEQYEIEEGKDYITKSPKSGGGLDYFLKGEIFKMILMRARNTRKYADYFILLEKCVKYYNDFEKLKLEHRINEINKIKLLTLANGQTLDKYMIIKCDEGTLHIRKYKGMEYVYKT